jgi:hypothetical protein
MTMQTQEELLIELTVSALNHWVGSGKKPAALLVTENNSLVITSTIIEHIKQTGRKPDVEQVDKIVKSLGDIRTGGKLEYAQIEDPKAKKKEAFEIAHSKGFKGGSQNNRTELQRDDQHKKPPLTEQDRVAINSRNARIDGIIADTLSTIGNYTGPSHARTYERREQLRAEFEKFKYQVKDEDGALKLQRTIAEKINSYDRSSSGGIR